MSISAEDIKKLKKEVGIAAAQRVQSGMVVGLGTGSTTAFAIEELGRRISTGELTDIVGIPTSFQASVLGKKYGIPIRSLDDVDRVDIAIAVGADGVHVGQTDLPVSAVRQVLNATLSGNGNDASQYIIGQSTTSPQELDMALHNQVDYVGVGPVHATPTQPNKAASGYEYVSYANEHLDIPWFAIGGLDENNLSEAIAAGAKGVAVVRALMKAEHPDRVARQMRSLY